MIINIMESDKITSLLIGAIITIMMSGCATPQTTRQQNPAAHYQSSKSAKDCAVCIADKWENLALLGGTMPINMRPISNGYTLSIGTARTQLLVDIVDVVGGSETTYYKNFVIGEGSFDKAVESCQ
jgi:hypothetical protein